MICPIARKILSKKITDLYDYFRNSNPEMVEPKLLKITLLYIKLVLSINTFGQVKNILVKPSVTDNKIITFTEDHHKIFYKNNVNPKGLLVYLPASFHLTSSAESFCHTGANAGYVVISLAYPGTNILYDACAHNTTLTCFEDIHREIIDGKNYNLSLKIDSTEGILYRLKALLNYLKLNDKNINWLEYFDENENVKLVNTTWAGHSDAAGRVAVLAKYNTVKRVILLSGPKDFSEHFYVPPIWMNTGVWKTDKSNMYSFSHGQDDYLIQQEIWDSLGIKKFGKTVNIGQVNYPYNNTHQLITTETVAVGDRHYCTVVDNITPMREGIPIFEPVWKYLLDVPLVSTPVTNKKSLKNIKIYPNPLKSGEKLIVEIDSDTDFSILNLNGQSIQGGKVSQLNTHDMTPGVYLLKLYTTTFSTTIRKLIIY